MKYLSEILNRIEEPKNKDRIFLISGREKYTYAQLTDQVKAIGKFSQTHRLEGKTILVSLMNDFEILSTILGLVSVGASVLLLDPKTKKRRLTNILSLASIDGWIVDQSSAQNWQLEPKPVAIEISPKKPANRGVLSKMLKKKNDDADRSFTGWTNTLERMEVFPKIAPDQTGLILFTSGTTSDPKGVPLSHENIIHHLGSLSRQYQLNEQSVILNVLPLYHADGLIQGPFLALYNSITISRPLEFEIPKIEELMLSVYKHKVTHFIAVPTMLKLIDEFGAGLEDSFDTPEFACVISAAAYLDNELWAKFMNRFKVRIVNVYGLTETVAGSFFCGPDDDSFKIGTVGKPVDTEVKIVDDEDKVLETNEIGELVIKGNHVIKSYLSPTGNPDSEGWFYTGDLGFIDQDGFYHVKGRKKSLIIRGGINTYPEEIREVVNHHPEISDSFIYGEKDDTWGEKIMIAVIKHNESTIETSDIMKYLSTQLEAEHMPDHIHLVDSLAKGPSGKIIEEKVRMLVQNQSNSQSATNNSIELKSILLKLAEESFNSRISPEQYHLESGSIQGWNSLAHLHLATRIEETFHVKLSAKDIMSITSLSSAESILKNKLDKS